MILKDSENNKSIDQLETFYTSDGSVSLKSSKFNEAFHSSAGAKQEADEKFIRPSQLERYSEGSTLYVLDVCVGMGYNTASLMERLLEKRICLNWWGPVSYTHLTLPTICSV